MGSIITSEELDDMAISTQKDWLQHEFAPVLEEDRAFWHFTPAHVKATLRPRLKFATQEFITVIAYGRCRKITLLYMPLINATRVWPRFTKRIGIGTETFSSSSFQRKGSSPERI